MPMVSSGPFHVTEVKNGKYVKMEKNEYYKDGFGVEPTIDQVFFNMYQTQDGVVADYKAGNLDAAIELDPGFFQSLKGVPGSTSVAAPGLGFHELGMNSYDSPKSKGNKLLLDKNIRVAIDYAVDKEAIAAVAMSGLAKPGVVAALAGRHVLPLGGAGRPAAHLRPGEGQAASSTTRATRSAPTASARTPRATSSSSG